MMMTERRSAGEVDEVSGTGLVHREECLGRAKLGIDHDFGLPGHVHFSAGSNLRPEHGLEAGVGVLIGALQQNESRGTERGSGVARVELEPLLVHFASGTQASPLFLDTSDEREGGGLVGPRCLHGGPLDLRQARGGSKKLVGIVDLALFDQQFRDGNACTHMVRAELLSRSGCSGGLFAIAEHAIAAGQAPLRAGAVVLLHGAVECIDRGLPFAGSERDLTGHQIDVDIGRVLFRSEREFGSRGGCVRVAEGIGRKRNMNARRFVPPALQVHAKHVRCARALDVLSVAHLIEGLVQEAPCDQRSIQGRTVALALEPCERLSRGGVGICRGDQLGFLDCLRNQNCIAGGGEERLH